MKNVEFLEKTDAELVKLSIESSDNFMYLMQKYQDKLIRFILRSSNLSLESAEDILQETFIKVYKNLNDFDSDLKFSSWIYRICRNEMITHIRKTKARPQTITIDDEDGKKILNTLKSEVDIEKELNSKDLSEEVNNLLIQIPSKYREVLILRYLEEKDYNEISDILKMPQGTVATLLNRGKKILKQLIENDEKFLSLKSSIGLN